MGGWYLPIIPSTMVSFRGMAWMKRRQSFFLFFSSRRLSYVLWLSFFVFCFCLSFFWAACFVLCSLLEIRPHAYQITSFFPLRVSGCLRNLCNKYSCSSLSGSVICGLGTVVLCFDLICFLWVVRWLCLSISCLCCFVCGGYLGFRTFGLGLGFEWICSLLFKPGSL